MFKCQPCDRTFKSERALEKHARYATAHTRPQAKQMSKGAAPKQKASQTHRRSFPASKNADPVDEMASGFSTMNLTPARLPSQRTRDSNNSKQKQAPCSTYPDRHQEVADLIAPDGLSLEFNAQGDSKDSIRTGYTNLVGLFTCRKRACPAKKWSSRVIATEIHLYSGRRYNAVVWHQRCEQCDEICSPTLDETYAERVSRRLKIWHGIEVPMSSGPSKITKPHRSELCEGCKRGVCRQQEYLRKLSKFSR